MESVDVDDDDDDDDVVERLGRLELAERQIEGIVSTAEDGEV